MPDVTRFDLEFPVCPLCKAGTPLDPLYAFDKGFGYRVCRGCGLYILSPRLPFSSTREFYQSNEYFRSNSHEIGYDSYEQDEACHRRTFLERLKILKRFCPQGKLLDVGCGYGYLLQEARAMGYDGYGVDVSPEAVARVKKLLEPEDSVWEGTIDVLRDKGILFNAICMTDLFEHIYEPRSFLATCAGLLSPGGFLLLVTPDTGSLLCRVSGRNWVSFKIPEHVYLYNKKNLSNLLSAHFKIRKTYPARQYCYGRFLFDPMAALNPAVRTLAVAVHALWPALDRKMFYVTSGSRVVLAQKESKI